MVNYIDSSSIISLFELSPLNRRFTVSYSCGFLTYLFTWLIICVLFIFFDAFHWYWWAPYDFCVHFWPAQQQHVATGLASNMLPHK